MTARAGRWLAVVTAWRGPNRASAIVLGSTVPEASQTVFFPINRAALGFGTWPTITWSDGNTTGILGKMKQDGGLRVRLPSGQVMVIEFSKWPARFAAW